MQSGSYQFKTPIPVQVQHGFEAAESDIKIETPKINQQKERKESPAVENFIPQTDSLYDMKIQFREFMNVEDRLKDMEIRELNGADRV